MEISQKPQKKEYPYLAIMTFGDPVSSTKKHNVDDILVVSMVSENGEDAKLYVQHLNGCKQGWFAKGEKDYAPLPKGFKVSITQ